MCNAKHYHLSKSEKDRYKLRHPQVAPDVRHGLNKQSKAPDIYSVGRILSSINEKPIPAVVSIVNMCLQYDSKNRPPTHDLCKQIMCGRPIYRLQNILFLERYFCVIC